MRACWGPASTPPNTSPFSHSDPSPSGVTRPAQELLSYSLHREHLLRTVSEAFVCLASYILTRRQSWPSYRCLSKQSCVLLVLLHTDNCLSQGKSEGFWQTRMIAYRREGQLPFDPRVTCLLQARTAACRRQQRLLSPGTVICLLQPRTGANHRHRQSCSRGGSPLERAKFVPSITA